MQGDVLVAVLSRLEPRQLGVAACVAKSWRLAAAEALPPAFVRAHCLAGVSRDVGAPRRPGFMETASLGALSFARLHQVVRSDSFTSLAVRYRVSPTAIKRANGLISDHSLFSRVEVFVPLASPAELAGRRVQIRYCPASKRDVAVVLEGRAAQEAAEADEAARQLAANEAARQAEALRVKMGQLLGRSLRCDNATALYYIDQAGGDVKAALSAARDDAAWDDTTAGPMLTAPLQRWISGEAGL